ncbi:extracellular solute-binding protein [Octadecabacter sp. 1_MG-2023]|uniref:extracellular solute-binding protein n=1 Tax=unclassified Octadecabacter TaxID=196158 RepID=UPI001C08833C|nr:MULTISPECIES: extracellular solute-binding protein [unclassified Octadecabacter]MBU2994237.1 extracellular solute-binding protein [Octadecabacter sp. B2R22]MDO6734474.1 extracellular solute-binding protein [Octadecabacter sp. 1_MG-2023]
MAKAQHHSHAPRSKAAVQTQQLGLSKWGMLLAGSVLVIGAASMLRADSHEEVIISHGYTNFGELKYPVDMAHLDYVNPDAPKGGEMSLWTQGTFDTFNNFTREGATAAGTTILYESIMTATADDPYGSYCYLCTTIEYPESKDWVIFNLRDDVTFSDGSAFTAEDVVFFHELIMDQGLPEYVAVVEGYVEKVEVLDTHRVRFTFTPEAPRRDVIGIAGSNRAFSKAWFAETGARLDESTDVPFLGTGAYVLGSYDTNRNVVYQRDPNWWGAEHPMNVGQANFDSIRYEYFTDSAAAFEAFKAGEYTFRQESSSLQWATGYEFPSIENGWVRKEELPDGTIGSAQAFIFNLRDERFQDPKVREAIRLMFNFEWSNETLFYGLYDRVESFWQNTDLQAQGVPSEAELALLQPLVDEGLLDASILTDEAVLPPTSSAGRPTDRTNLRLASALLDEAGWIAGDDGMRRKDGQVLEVEFLSASPGFDRIINPYVESLQRLGVDATLNRVDFAQYVERLDAPSDFDMITHTMTQGFEPGSGLRQWFGSETAADSSRNLMGLEDPAVDRLLTNVINATGLEEMTVGTQAIDRVLRAKGFWVPQWYKSTHTVAYYDIYEYPENLPPFSLGNTSFWWYNAERAEELKAAGAF